MKYLFILALLFVGCDEDSSCLECLEDCADEETTPGCNDYCEIMACGITCDENPDNMFCSDLVND